MAAKRTDKMTQKQIVALRRILDWEVETYQVRMGRPAPGQHQSEDKVAVTDGNICVLLDNLSPELPIGERADTFVAIVRNERTSDGYFPIPANQIRISEWRALARKRTGDAPGVELTVRQDNKFELPYLSLISGRFNPQLLVDAVDVVGGKPQLFMGIGRFNARFPGLLAFPSPWTESGDYGPVVLLFSLRI